MDNEKLILEIFGKVSATETNVTHLLTQQKTINDKVDVLHKRVDGQDKKIAYGLGVFAALGFCLKMAWEHLTKVFRG